MPRTYKNYKKKTPRKKTYRKRGTVSYGQVKKIVNTTLNRRVEKKTLGYEYTTTVSDVSFLYRFYHPIQGIGDDQRIGDSLYVKSITINYLVSLADTTNFVRMILFQWMDDSSTGAPVIDDILSVYAGTYTYNSPFNTNTTDKYRIIRQKSFTLNANRPQIHGTMQINTIPVRKWQFTDALGGIQDNIRKGQLYMFVITDSGAIPHPGIIISSKINFTDA